jgi:hypothetical protein
MQTYSENSAGGESSPATDNPDMDGSPGSSSAEMPAEEAGIQSDNRPSPLSDQPDDHGSVPHPPATPVASRPNDTQEDETWPIIPEMDQDKAPDESRMNVAELGRKRALSSATELRSDTGHPRVQFLGPVPAPVNTVPIRVRVWGQPENRTVLL